MKFRVFRDVLSEKTDVSEVRTASIFRAVNGFNLPDDEDRTHL
jgi:hypothetical protein